MLIAAALLVGLRAGVPLAPPAAAPPAKPPAGAAPAPAGSAPAAPAQPGTSLTLYSFDEDGTFDPQIYIQAMNRGEPSHSRVVPGFGVVRSVRSLDIPSGVGTVSFTDVAAFIDPSTVIFEDLQDPSTAVLEQSFQFDLVSPSQLLERYVDRDVRLSYAVGDQHRTMKGKLLAVREEQAILQDENGIHIVPLTGNQVDLSNLPGGLLTRPTLQWKLRSSAGGPRMIRASYQTAGMTWRSDYSLLLDESESHARLSAWVTVLNVSGMAFPDAQIKLIAGTVNRVRPEPEGAIFGGGGGFGGDISKEDAFAERTFGDYHLYTLPRAATLASNSTQQLALFAPVDGIAVQKTLSVVFGHALGFGAAGRPHLDAGTMETETLHADVCFTIENKEANRLGIPLPAGLMRVYKLNTADGTLEFLGEDRVLHTPRNEAVRVRIGSSFDVLAERTRTDFKVSLDEKFCSETFQVEVRNQSAVERTVTVTETMWRWLEWKVENPSAPFTKTSASTGTFTVTLPPEGKQTITYTVRYTW